MKKFGFDIDETLVEVIPVIRHYVNKRFPDFIVKEKFLKQTIKALHNEFF